MMKEKRGKLTIIEHDNRFEMWEDDLLIAYAKKSETYEDLVHAYHYHGGYESPCKLDEFIIRAVESWIRGHEPRDKSLDEHYIELLEDDEMDVVIRKFIQLPYQKKVEWIKKNPDAVVRMLSSIAYNLPTSMKEGNVMKVKDIVNRFFDKYADFLDKEFDIYIEKECEEDWDDDWAIFFVFDDEEKENIDINQIAEMLRKEFEDDESIKIKVWEGSNEIEVYREDD